MSTEPSADGIDLSDKSDSELVSLRMAVDAELSKRGINFSVGEVGERVAVEFFNSKPGLPNLMEAPTGAKNVDALSRDGDRYSIKTQVKAKKSGTIYPDRNDTEKQLFEYLLIVRLSRTYQLEALHRFSWDQFCEARAWDKRMNAWYIPVSKKRLALAERIV